MDIKNLLDLPVIKKPTDTSSPAEPATSTIKKTIPSWLPKDVKTIYRQLIKPLPPLDPIRETTLIQLSFLKRELEQYPESISATKHNIMRQLVVLVSDWIKEEQAKQDDNEPDAFLAYQKKTNRLI